MIIIIYCTVINHKSFTITYDGKNQRIKVYHRFKYINNRILPKYVLLVAILIFSYHACKWIIEYNITYSNLYWCVLCQVFCGVPIIGKKAIKIRWHFEWPQLFQFIYISLFQVHSLFTTSRIIIIRYWHTHVVMQLCSLSHQTQMHILNI